MGRSKGETFHKNKRKEYLRIRCRGWTIREDILVQLSCASNTLGVCESRIVEIAIKNILTKTSDKIQNPAKIFTKN